MKYTLLIACLLAGSAHAGPYDSNFVLGQYDGPKCRMPYSMPRKPIGRESYQMMQYQSEVQRFQSDMEDWNRCMTKWMDGAYNDIEAIKEAVNEANRKAKRDADMLKLTR